MESFFTKKEVETTDRVAGKRYTCISCGAFKTCDNPKFAMRGNFEKGIMNIISMPTSMEDSSGQTYKSKEGRYLEKALGEMGIDLHADCINGHAIRCNVNTPSFDYVDCCRKGIMEAIKAHKPKVIVLYGDMALYSVIGGRWKKDLGNINKWNGYLIPDQELGCWILPLLEPGKVMDSKNKVEPTIFKNNLLKLQTALDTPFPKYEEPHIITLEDDLSVLDKIQSGLVAFDYETTGIKPHEPGHRIVCASVAVSENKVYVFKLPDTRQQLKPFLDLLQRKEVGKIAQNMKFEDTWTNVRLRVPVNGWVYDTMLAAHVMDNRTGVKGLKFQAYVHLGVIDYNSDIAPYLKATDNTNTNSINKIMQLFEKPGGTQALLKYCALDSIYEYRLAMKSKPYMLGTVGESPISPSNSSYPHAYNLLHEGTLALAKAERQGLRIDIEYCETQKHRLTKKIEALEKQFYDTAFYRQWCHASKSTVNINSDQQLAFFLYSVRKVKPTKLSESGKGSTDEEALKSLNIPELDLLIKRGKLLKIRDTYLDAFMREQSKGYLHPFFNLHIAKTYRSSSQNPNFQNIPKRDTETMKLVRDAIFPRPGNQLLEMDFSGIEVAIAACYHKDPNMIKYIMDPTTDMHGDMAAQIFMIKNWDRKCKDHKYLRGATKNSFVFPQFYGDYYRNCASNICGNWLSLSMEIPWKKGMGYKFEDGSHISDLLISKGITSYEKFVSHMEKIEKDFWGKRFAVYAKWKETHYENYIKTGYVTLYTGFTCGGVMFKNDVINYPVQGAAFHCLLWMFIQLSKAFEEKGMNTKLVGQIHDAVVLDVHPDELQEVYALIIEYGTKKLLEAFKWINVPLSIEAELCPVDGSWATKQDWDGVVKK